MTTEQQPEDDDLDKKKVTRMSFAERYSIVKKMEDMVANGHSLLPAKNWKSLANVIRQLTGLPAYGSLCKEIAEVAGIHEDKLIEKRVTPEEQQQTEIAALRQRVEALEAIVKEHGAAIMTYQPKSPLAIPPSCN